jgi:RNA polymerase sigma-70 factor, ECF subfamily
VDGARETSEPDRDWVRAAGGGDRAAFERLYRHYEMRVFRYLSTLVRDRALAEELVCETMLAVWRAASGFAQASRVSTWIFGIARHKALDALRRVARQREEVPLEEAADIPDPGESAADRLTRGEDVRQLRAALARLSSEHQEVLRLVFHEELPYDEIAHLLAIPVNTVKTRVYYAKQQLKRNLEQAGGRLA